MKHYILSAAAALALLLTGDALNAQVVSRDSIIAVFPYFYKGESHIYLTDHKVSVTNGADTTVVKHISEEFLVSCTKASDTKGYTLEETFLSFDDMLISDSLSAKAKYQEAYNRSFLGMKIAFTIDKHGENLALKKGSKVSKEFRSRLNSAHAALEEEFSSESDILANKMTVSLDSIILTPEHIMHMFPEMSKLFEFHGQVFDYEKEEYYSFPPELNGEQEGIVQIVAFDCPEEGEEPRDYYDDYTLVLQLTRRFDAKTSFAYGLAILSLFVDLSSVELPSDYEIRIPEGEVTMDEVIVNLYFNTGWPKRISYEKEIRLGEVSVIETFSIDSVRRNMIGGR